MTQYERNAEYILAKHYTKLVMPVDIFAILNDMGVIIVKEDNFEQPNYTTKITYKNNQLTIKLNPLLSTSVEKFALAHALGHYCMGHLKIKSTLIDFQENYQINKMDLFEREANDFAGALLVPERILKPKVFYTRSFKEWIDDLFSLTKKNDSSVNGLATFFQVSEVLIANRLKKTKII